LKGLNQCRLDSYRPLTLSFAQRLPLGEANFTGVARQFPAYREVDKYYSSTYPTPQGGQRLKSPAPYPHA
ncbi:hypothetical protein LC605_03215, partial [Nostoc sp. CHAB 5836]|uniref:hypothetical protein n=1 Tax=Nostoc sp. CHAB 5836 TaxID=2780404 RepID=UPI001E41D0FE